MHDNGIMHVLGPYCNQEQARLALELFFGEAANRRLCSPLAVQHMQHTMCRSPCCAALAMLPLLQASAASLFKHTI